MDPLSKSDRGPLTHYVKCWPEPFEEIFHGRKRHEVRKNDRDYRQGDTVWLVEWDPGSKEATGRRIRFNVGHVTVGGQWGLPEGMCVFSLLM